MEDEQALMAAVRKRDPNALAAVHDRYYGALYGYIAYRVGDPLEAEDLTSEVFTRLLASLREGRQPRTTLRGWLFGVASNVVADYHRSAYHTQHVELNESLVDTDSGLLDVLHRKLTHESLARALEELTEEQRAVISLRFGAGMAIREVAKTLGRSEAAVKMLQARALAALGRRLAA